MLDEECFQETKEALFKHMEQKEGPYNITLSLVLRVFNTQKWNVKPLNQAYAIKARLIDELCIFKLQIPNDFNITQIRKIDDSDDYMYGIENHEVNEMNVQNNYLFISDEKIAALLRIVYGYKLISKT